MSIDWKARAEAAEARIQELEALMPFSRADATTLGNAIYDDKGVLWRERALYLQDRVEELRIALTAALENKS